MATALLIPMHDVQSSLLKQIGHDAETFTFSARFLPGKKSPSGKVYHYANVSEEVYDDVANPKNGMSVGEAFSAIIKKNPDKYPCECVDEGLGEAEQGTFAAAVAATAAIVEGVFAEIVIPDDEEGLKALALSTRGEATMVTISNGEECEFASREVLRIRAERKVAIAKINKIKEPATAAWKAAVALFNEVDGKYAEAESFLDQGIITYRAKEKKRIADENARLLRQQQEEQAANNRRQQEEFQRAQKIANEEAAQKAAQLAEEDAKVAEAQGATAEVVQQIRETPVPVEARHVAPPPLVMATAPAPLAQNNIPKVSGLSYSTEWFYQITDESLIPFTHEYYTLDLKKVNAKVQSLKKHANIAGVLVDSREVPIKRTAR